MRQIAAGRMTASDGQALVRWCKADPRHADAMASARREWEMMKHAGQLSLARYPAWEPPAAASSLQTGGLSTGLSGSSGPSGPSSRKDPWPRRAFLGSAFGAAAAVAATAVVVPPLGLWPSLGELRADLRTGTGEQRRVALAGAVDIELNTRTSVAVWPGSRGEAGIDLVAGEAAVDMSALGPATPFSVRAGAGKVVATGARFEVRCLAGEVRVTCLQGQTSVEHVSGTVRLAAQQQLRYTDVAVGRVVDVDGAKVSAWRDGFLRFSDTPLGEVVDEINRYRAGRVVLVGERLASKAVTGRFQIHALDKAIVQMQRSLDLQVRSLPGGVVLLS